MTKSSLFATALVIILAAPARAFFPKAPRGFLGRGTIQRTCRHYALTAAVNDTAASFIVSLGDSSSSSGSSYPTEPLVEPFLYESPIPNTIQTHHQHQDHQNRHRPLPVDDPAGVEFVSVEQVKMDQLTQQQEQAAMATAQELSSAAGFYPFAAMMQGSAPYIAAHAGEIAVFYIPGDLVDEDADQNVFDSMLSDMALSWLLGLKLVIVVGCRSDSSLQEECAFYANSHECHNSLRVTDKDTLRKVEEQAGYLRTEIERKLNRLLRMHGGVTASNSGGGAPEGNALSGNFYTAQFLGEVRDVDFEYTGFATNVHTRNMRKVLESDDVVLLTTVGLSRTGDLVNVNGYHLAATVASALKANKLIYLATQGSVLKKKGENLPIQEAPVSFIKALLEHHKVKVHNTGFATFEHARQSLEPRATELLIHLGWATWALERGVTRAHIVNPTDGALLEELFTSKNGLNTCVYHDDEHTQPEEAIAQEDWDEFFAAAAAQVDG